MTILHCLETIDPAFGGPVEAARQFAGVSAEAGVPMEVLTLDDDVSQWAARWPVPVHALGRGKTAYRYNPKLMAWLRERAPHYDAVVVHGIWGYHTVGTWQALRGSGTPYFVIPHGMLNPWLKDTYPGKHLKKSLFWHTVVYRALQGAAAVQFLCEEEPVLAQETFSTSRCNVEIAPLGIADFSGQREAQINAFLEHCPEAKGKRLILFLGRICLMKGCDLLVEAFHRTASLDPDVYLMIAGPDEDVWQQDLKRRAQALGVGDRILWPGPLYGDWKWGAQHYAEAFTLPSHCETFPVAVLEALACGSPVLITPKVNIWREIAQDDAAIVAPNTVEGTEQALARWMQMPLAERKEWSVRAIACYRRRFEIRKALELNLQLYGKYARK
jgi:glycosyltransferase involved in cell wall biosynthesis